MPLSITPTPCPSSEQTPCYKKKNAKSSTPNQERTPLLQKIGVVFVLKGKYFIVSTIFLLYQFCTSEVTLHYESAFYSKSEELTE